MLIVPGAAAPEREPRIVAIDAFRDLSQDTAELDAATLRAVDTGCRHNILMPVVAMAGRAAIEICGLSPNVPRQMVQRAMYAGSVAVETALKAHGEGWIYDYYMSRQDLRNEVQSRSLWPMIRDPDVITTLSYAPFMDARYLVGGAKQKLDMAGITAGQAEIIGNSPSLLLFAQIDADCTREIAGDLLGGPPYIDPDSLMVGVDPDGSVTLGFTSAAQSYLRALMTPGGGCPAAKVRLTIDPGSSLLQEALQGTADFLLCEGMSL